MTTPKLNWKSGPPQQGIGWYVASYYAGYENVYRWWNGQLWSLGSLRHFSAEEVARAASLHSSDQKGIRHLPKNLNRKQT